MIRKLLDYLTRVKNDESEIDHLWSIHIAKVLAKLGFWYDTDSWAQANWATKLRNRIIFPIIYILIGPLVIWRILTDYGDLSVARMAEGISHALGGCMSFFINTWSGMQREMLTQVIQSVDEKFLAVPKDTPRFQKWWKETRRNYVTEGYTLLVFSFFSFAISVPQLLFMVVTGRLFYDTAMPLSDESYKWQWWLQVAYQSFGPFCFVLYGTLKELMCLSTYYHLSALYRVQADTIMELYERKNYDPEVEYQKLRRVFQELRELEGTTQKFNLFISPTMLALGATAYAMISISVVSLLIQSKDGWLSAIVQSIVWPVYILLIMGVWSMIGQMLSESVEEVDNALYNCNWLDAPMKVKRLILMYMIRKCKPTYIRGGPYFIMNWEFFSEVLKKSYCLLTLLADVLL